VDQVSPLLDSGEQEQTTLGNSDEFRLRISSRHLHILRDACEYFLSGRHRTCQTDTPASKSEFLPVKCLNRRWTLELVAKRSGGLKAERRVIRTVSCAQSAGEAVIHSWLNSVG